MNLKAGAVASIVAVAAGIAVVRFAQQPKPASGFTPVAAPQRSVHASPRPAASSLVVYVAGSVARPGVYALSEAARTVDAVRSAGGAVAGADLVRVNLAEPLTDGEEIVVPSKTDSATEDVSTAPASRTKHRTAKGRRRHAAHHRKRALRKRRTSDAEAAAATDATADANASEPSDPVDINRADESELESLPGIGAALAERIVAFRELNGPYASFDDLLDVAGMTQKRLDDIQPFLASI